MDVADRSVSRIDAPRAPPRGASEPFRCHSCGDVIGVYEPLVVCDEDGTHTTSRAAEPALQISAAVYYHGDCHAEQSEAIAEPARREAYGR